MQYRQKEDTNFKVTNEKDRLALSAVIRAIDSSRSGEVHKGTKSDHFNCLEIHFNKRQEDNLVYLHVQRNSGAKLYFVLVSA